MSSIVISILLITNAQPVWEDRRTWVADQTPRKIVGALRRGRRGGFDEGKVQLVNGHHQLVHHLGVSMVMGVPQ